MKTNYKEKYIELLEEAPIEDPMIENLKLFLKSHEGGDSEELQILVMSIIGMLIRTEKLKIDAAAYQEIKAAKDVTKKELEGIKMQFEAVTTGKPPKPMVEVALKP